MTEPKTFRKKPVEVEAMQWDGTAAGATPIIDWVLAHDGTASYACSDPAHCVEHDGASPHTIAIDTREGRMHAVMNDWVIREPFPTDDRRFYPCKPAIFEATYEEAVAPWVTRWDAS